MYFIILKFGILHGFSIVCCTSVILCSFSQPGGADVMRLFVPLARGASLLNGYLELRRRKT